MHPQEISAALREALKHTGNIDRVSRGDQLQCVCKVIAAACEQAMELELDSTNKTIVEVLTWVHDEVLVKSPDLPTAIETVYGMAETARAGGKIYESDS